MCTIRVINRNQMNTKVADRGAGIETRIREYRKVGNLEFRKSEFLGCQNMIISEYSGIEKKNPNSVINFPLSRWVQIGILRAFIESALKNWTAIK